ncbi:MAG: hypothetical protein AAGU23_06600 [Bacillota bacterium]
MKVVFKPAARARNTVPPKEEAYRIQLYKQGLDDIQMAAKLGMTRAGIVAWRRARRLPSNNPPEKIYAITDNRRELYNQGLSDDEISATLKLLPGTIRQWRKKNGLPAHENKAFKEKFTPVKIAPNIREDMRRLRSMFLDPI